MPINDREKRRKYQREWRSKRRSSWFEDKSCKKCGAFENLELDHIDATQKVSHKIWSWSQKRRDEELAKCQVLCRECHMTKSWEEDGRQRAQHGSSVFYDLNGCRCDVCKAYKSKKNAKRYE